MLNIVTIEIKNSMTAMSAENLIPSSKRASNIPLTVSHDKHRITKEIYKIC